MCTRKNDRTMFHMELENGIAKEKLMYDTYAKITSREVQHILIT